MFKKVFFALAFTSQVFATAAGSQGSAASISLSGQGIEQIVSGSGQLLQAGSQLSVAAVKTVGEITFITLRMVGNSATVTLRLGSTIVGHGFFATGQMVQVVTSASGVILISAGQVVAFLPNALGKSLIYSSL